MVIYDLNNRYLPFAGHLPACNHEILRGPAACLYAQPQLPKSDQLLTTIGYHTQWLGCSGSVYTGNCKSIANTTQVERSVAQYFIVSIKILRSFAAIKMQPYL